MFSSNILALIFGSLLISTHVDAQGLGMMSSLQNGMVRNLRGRSMADIFERKLSTHTNLTSDPGYLALTQAETENEPDSCSINARLAEISQVFEWLIPDEVTIGTTAVELINMQPCSDLPLTRTRSDNSTPRFGYVAVYAYILDVLKAVLTFFISMMSFASCAICGKSVEDLVEIALDEVTDALGPAGKWVEGLADELSAINDAKDDVQSWIEDRRSEDNPMANFVAADWIDPNNCVDHSTADFSVSCSNDMPCCSYDLDDDSGNPFAEFHPLCSADGLCNLSNVTETCYKEGVSCATSSECCQKENQMMICQYDDDDYESGTCVEAPDQPVGWNPFCVAYSEKSFALAFGYPIPGLRLDPMSGKVYGEIFPSKKGKKFKPPRLAQSTMCPYVNGWGSKTPNPLAPVHMAVKFKGIGVGWGEDLAYGTNTETSAIYYGDIIPKVWDGYLSVPLPENPGTNFWLAFRVNVVPTIKQIYDIAACHLYGTGVKEPEGLPNPDGIFKLMGQFDFEVYVDTGATDNGDECAIVAMTGAMVKVSFVKFVFFKGMGGWCKSSDMCSPSGFFFNVEPAIDVKIMGQSVLEYFLEGLETAGVPSHAADVTGGFSLGVFVDSETEDVTSTVFRLETPGLKIFGLQVAPTMKLHFQWFKGSELNRRIETLLRKDGVPNCSVITADCSKWRPYERWVHGVDIYEGEDVEICVDRLLDLDPYNMLMTASKTSSDNFSYPSRISASDANKVDTWYSNPKFDQYANPDSDNIVLYFGVSTWANPIVSLSDLSFTFIMQVEGDKDISFSGGQNATVEELDALVAELEGVSSDKTDVDVYAEIYCKVTVLYVASLEIAASLQNNVYGEGTYDEWVVAASFSVSVPAVGTAVFKIKSSPFKWNNIARRELLESANDEEEYQRAMRELTENAEPDYDVSVKIEPLQFWSDLADGIMNAVDLLFVQPFVNLYNTFVAIGEFLVDKFEDTIFDPTVWGDVKDLAVNMMVNLGSNAKEVWDEMKDGDWKGACSAAMDLAKDAFQDSKKILKELDDAFDATLDAAVDFGEAIAGVFTDGACKASWCHKDDMSPDPTTVDEYDDEYGCTVKEIKVEICCKCRDSCNTPCTKMCDNSKKSDHLEYDEECRTAKILELEEEEERYAREVLVVESKLTQSSAYMTQFEESSETEDKLRTFASDSSQIGTPMLDIQEFSVASGGAKSRINLQAKALGLPKVQADSTDALIADVDLFGDNQLYDIDFSLQSGEDSDAAQERIIRELTQMASSKAVEASLEIANLGAGPGNVKHVTACGSSAGSCAGKEEVLDTSELRAIRCCVDSSYSGPYQEQAAAFQPQLDILENQKSIFKAMGASEAIAQLDKQIAAIESKLQMTWGDAGFSDYCASDDVYGWAAEEFGECLMGDLWTAKSVCEAEGYRLCTKDEVENDCTRGSGCNYDGKMIWTSDFEKIQPKLSSERHYTACGNSNKNCANKNELLIPSEQRPVRCCGDSSSMNSPVATDTFTPLIDKVSTVCPVANTHGVVGYSIERDGECLVADLGTAEFACEEVGLRLCTREELEDDCTKGSGCNFDDDLIWSSTKEEVISMETSYFAACGGTIGDCAGQTELSTPERTHAVRCCMESDDGTPSMVEMGGELGTWQNGKEWVSTCAADGIYGESAQMKGSCLFADYGTAKQVCTDIGARLCTKEELQSDCAKGSGCQFDHELVWSSTSMSHGGEYCASDGMCAIGSCDISSHTCEIGDRYDLCDQDRHCRTNLYCNHNTAPARCDLGTNLLSDYYVPGRPAEPGIVPSEPFYDHNCDENSDCDDGQFCHLHAETYGNCLAEPEGSCSSSTECYGNCDNGFCESVQHVSGDYCRLDSMCDGGKCDDETSTCLGDRYGLCSDDSDCITGLICNTLLDEPLCDIFQPGMPLSICENNNDCFNRNCDNNHCALGENGDRCETSYQCNPLFLCLGLKCEPLVPVGVGPSLPGGGIGGF